MARIGFIGLGNMGLPMARNLIKAGHQVTGFDVSKAGVDGIGERRRYGAPQSAAQACADADVVITMLPAGQHVRAVYSGEGGVIAAAQAGHIADRLLHHRRGVRACRCCGCGRARVCR